MSDQVSGDAARGVVWLGSSTVVVSLLRLIVGAILARLLTPDEFGIVGAALIAAGLIGTVANHGLLLTVVQRLDLEQRHRDTAFVMAAVGGVAAAIVMLILAPWVESVFGIEGVAEVLRALSLMPLMDSLAMMSNAVLQRNLEFSYLARIQIVSYVLGYAVVGIAAAVAGAGAWALVYGALGQVFISMLLQMVKAPPSWPRQVRWDALTDLVRVSFGFSLGAVAFFTSQRVDDFGVGRWLGSEALGLYGRAYQLMSEPADKVGQVLAQVLFPAMSKIQSQTARLANAAITGAGLVALVMLPASLAAAILAEEVILVLLGGQWTEAIVPFRILAFGMLFRTSFNLSEAVSKATGAVYRRAWRQWFYALLVFVSVFVGHQFGLNGVAFGVAFAMALNFFLMAGLALKLINETWSTFLQAHLPAMRLAALVVVITWPLAESLRELGAHAWVTLGIAGGAATLAGVAAVVLLPRVFSMEQLPAVIASVKRKERIAGSE